MLWLEQQSSVLQFKYALRKLIMRNSIEPSKTGNCTNFDQALCEPSGLLNFTWKHKQQVSNETLQPTVHDITEERLLIHIDDECPNVLKDNILYYIGGFIVRKLIPKIHCKKCKNELFLDPGDPTAVTKDHILCMQSLHAGDNREDLHSDHQQC